MRNTISIIAVSMFATAGLAAPAAAATPTKAKPVKYCVAFEPNTGSRIHYTECMTKSQWSEHGIDVDELQRK